MRGAAARKGTLLRGRLLVALAAGASLAVGPSDFPADCTRIFFDVARSPMEVARWRVATAALTGRSGETSLNGVPYMRGNHGNIDDLTALTSGRKVHEIFIVTHQWLALEADTAAFLRDPRFAKVPRMVLTANGVLQMQSRQLANEATIVGMSNIGEFSANFDANVVHLAGGTCVTCLRHTAHVIGHELLDVRGRNTAMIRLHANLTYGVHGQTGGTLADGLRKLPFTEQQAAVVAFGREFMGFSLFHREGWGTPRVTSVTLSATFQPIYELTFTRKDGKTIKLVIEGI